jgi:hypothetical protein
MERWYSLYTEPDIAVCTKGIKYEVLKYNTEEEMG